MRFGAEGPLPEELRRLLRPERKPGVELVPVPGGTPPAVLASPREAQSRRDWFRHRGLCRMTTCFVALAGLNK